MTEVHASPSIRRVRARVGRGPGQGERARARRGASPRMTCSASCAGRRPPRRRRPRQLRGRAYRRSRRRISPSSASIETKPMSRIKRLSGPHLHRSWLNIPHVTHNDESDVTDLEQYRKELDTAAKDKGYRVTMLAFLLKASASALREFPEVNASLSPGKDALILQEILQYRHRRGHAGRAGGAGDPRRRPQGRHRTEPGDGRHLQEGAGRQAQRLRTCRAAAFTISSLGGIGGTAFTPIVNAPEVAILGVVRSKMAPVWNGTEFKPRLMLPISLSYDHRVIDGALAARFSRHLCHVLEDVRPAGSVATGFGEAAAQRCRVSEGICDGNGRNPRSRHRGLQEHPDHRDPRGRRAIRSIRKTR